MLRRLIAIFAIVLGLGIIGAAVGSATVWRPADQATAVLPAPPDEPVVVTAPGVLNMVDNEVRVRVIGADADTPLVLAMGHEVDVRAWIGTSPYLEITGLSSWEELEVEAGQVSPEPEETESPDDEATGDAEGADAEGTEDAEGADAEATEDAEGTDTEGTEDDEDADAEATEAPLPNPAGSDLWVEEVTDTGELTYTWTAVPGRWMMLVATDGTEPAPQVELTWSREVTTPLLIPGLILGGIVLLAGIAGLVLVLLVDRERARARRAIEAAALAEAEVPERKAGRHRGDGESEPLTQLLTGDDDETLTYAQRLGWPAATGEDATAEDEAVGGAAQAPADTAAPASAPVLTAPDGTPLTRRQIREAEEARRAEERRSSRRRRGRAAKETGTAEDTDSAAAEDSAATTAQASDTAAAEADGATAEPPNTTAEAGGQDTGLSEWVASGRSGQEAAPIETYPAAAPGERPHAAAAEDTSRPAGSEGAPDSASESGGEPGASTRRGTWWHPLQRRRRDTAEEEGTHGRRRGWRREQWAAPTEANAGGAADAPSEGENEPSDHDPHASGALWRQTWGIAPADSTSQQDQQATDTGSESAHGDRTDDSTEEGSR